MHHDKTRWKCGEFGIVANNTGRVTRCMCNCDRRNKEKCQFTAINTTNLISVTHRDDIKSQKENKVFIIILWTVTSWLLASILMSVETEMSKRLLKKKEDFIQNKNTCQ